MHIFNRPVSVILLACLLASATSAVWAGTAYVDLNSPSPSAPYASWATAATNIQDAIDAASAGDLVLVTNGVYQTGGRVVYGAMSNRVAVTKPVKVISVNGPAVTTIVGYQPPCLYCGTNDITPVRCVYLTNGALFSGFTLTNGATLESGNDFFEQSGGGVCCESSLATVSNCVIVGNFAFRGGGGSYSGTLNNCTLAENFSNSGGGGSWAGTLNNCFLNGNSAGDGGGAWVGTLNNCILRTNSASYGGGAWSSTLNNCVLVGNTASYYGGGVWLGTLNNCTVIGNSAESTGGGGGGGGGVSSAGYWYVHALPATVNNCIVYSNTAAYETNYDSLTTLNYCCTFPLPASGPGNFTNAPLFVNQAGGDFHLQLTSPCINSGFNGYARGVADLDGNARIRGGTVDVGAYEVQNPASVLSYAWLQQFGLAMDGSADFGDSDGDGMNNWQEWVAGTNPTNAASLLKLAVPALASGRVTLSWSSVTNRSYFVQRATDLKVPASFSLLRSNITGLAGITSHTDTNAPSPAFYRVGVQ